MYKNMNFDVDSAGNPAQVNRKRKKRMKKSGSIANDRDNNNTQIIEQTEFISTQISSDEYHNKFESVGTDLEKSDKEILLDNKVRRKKSKKKKKKGMEEQSNHTNDMDMVDQTETKSITTPVQEKDELKRGDAEVARKIEESKEVLELKNSLLRKTQGKDMAKKSTKRTKCERMNSVKETKVLDLDSRAQSLMDENMNADMDSATKTAQVNSKRKKRKKKSNSTANDHGNNGTQITEQTNVISTQIFSEDKKKMGKENRMQENPNDKDGIKIKDKIGTKSIGKLERGKNLFQRVKETIRLLFNPSIFDDNTSSDDEKKVNSGRKHQQVVNEVCKKIDEQNVKEKKDKPKEVNEKKLEREEQSNVVSDENEQPKKKRKRKNKKKNKNLEANTENGVQTEVQTVHEKEVHDKLEQEKQGIVVNDENEQPKKNKKRKKKAKNKNLEANSENGVQSEDQTVDNLLMASNLSVGKTLVMFSKKKLLVLDINGLLADVVYPAPKICTPDGKTAGRAIFMRPFYIDFLNFCFERFDVGIWSSRTKKIIDLVVECLLGKLKQKLIFCWDQTHCTPTRYKTLENKHKPLLFKELGKIWENKYPNLPWQKGFYSKSNTLLVDDSPYKAFLNPKNTAIFPLPFTHMEKQDSSLAPDGDIGVYLEKVAEAENIQKYVEQNPFGQVGITKSHESWSFYSKFEKLRSVE